MIWAAAFAVGLLFGMSCAFACLIAKRMHEIHRRNELARQFSVQCDAPIEPWEVAEAFRVVILKAGESEDEIADTARSLAITLDSPRADAQIAGHTLAAQIVAVIRDQRAARGLV